jgi:hypothetical protein
MNPVWVRKSRNGTSVVFVHGILSSNTGAWRNGSGQLWPRMLCDNEKIDDVGIYMFEYRADIFAGTYSLDDVVASLREYLRLDEVWSHAQKNLIFVGHSQGGIVARRFIIAQQTDLIERGASIGLFLVASPSGGSFYANFARLAPLHHVQVDALRFSQLNIWLNGLDTDFMNLKEKQRDKLRLFGKELIEDDPPVGKKFFQSAQIVPPWSAAKYFGEPIKIPYSDHVSIAKPESDEAMQHRLLVDFIDEAVKRAGDGAAADAGPASARKPRNPIVYPPPPPRQPEPPRPRKIDAPVPANTGFEEVKPGFVNPAIFFSPSESIVRGLRFLRDEAFYIRLIPTQPRRPPLTVRELYKRLQYRHVAIPSRSDPSGMPRENNYGAIALEEYQVLVIFAAVRAFTQIFKSSEIWGATPDPFIRFGDGLIVQVVRLRETFQRVLADYCALAAELDTAPPYHVEMGAAGLRHTRLALEPVRLHHRLFGTIPTAGDPIESEEFKLRLVLGNVSKEAQLDVVDNFILALLGLAGTTYP